MQYRNSIWIVYIAIAKVVLKFAFKPLCTSRNYLPKVIASLKEDEWYTDQVHETRYWLSCVQLFVTPWTVAHQAPPSMEFSRQEYWSGLPFPSPGDLPDPGIEPGSPALQVDALLSELPGNLRFTLLVE